jgi:hypothetical protein
LSGWKNRLQGEWDGKTGVFDICKWVENLFLRNIGYGIMVNV